MAELIDIFAWENTIRKATAYSQIAVAASNFDYFTGLIAMQKFAPKQVVMYHMMAAGGDTSNSGVPDETKQYLQNLAETNTKMVETKTKELKDEVEKTPESTKKDPDAWKAMIEKGTQKRIDEFAKMAHESADKAIEKIGQLPPEKREEAANSWEQAWAWVMNCIKTFMNAMDVLINGVIELWHKIAEAFVTAYNVVKQAVETAIDEIGNFFSSL